MGKLILILGELASGKTTLAHQISDRYAVPCFTKDRIKELICEKVAFHDREENLNLSYLAFDILLHIFESMAVTSQDLILESNFRQPELDRLKISAEAYGYDVLSVFLTGDLHILHARYLDRSRSGSRHFAHLSQDLNDFEAFESISCEKNPRSMFGQIVSIDTTSADCPDDLSLQYDIKSFLQK